jgi:hypothetical protein
MSDTVDHHTTSAADPFPAIVIEGDWCVTAFGQSLVHDIEHFEERHVRTDVGCRVRLEAARLIGTGLPPDPKREAHAGLGAHL